MNDAEIKIIITAEIAKFQQNIDKALAATKKLGEDVPKHTKEAGKGFLDFKNIAEVALGVNFANLAAEATMALKEFATEAFHDVIKLEEAMYALKLSVGGAAEALTKDLKAATHGTVDDLELVTEANRALALGVQQNQLVPLMEVARAQSKIMGTSVTDSFESITKSIGTMNQRGLIQAGIIINLDNAYAKYANTIHKTVGELTDQEKRTALVNAILGNNKELIEQINKGLDSHKDALDRASVALHDFLEREMKGLIEIYEFTTLSMELEDKTNAMMKEKGITYDQAREKVIALKEEEVYQAEHAMTSAMAIKHEADALINLQTEINGTIKSMKDLVNTPLMGENENNVDLAKGTQALDTLKSQLDELQQKNLDAFGVSDLNAQTVDFLTKAHEGNTTYISDLNSAAMEQQKIKFEINNQEKAVTTLADTQKSKFTDTKKVMDAQLDLWINQKTGVIKTREEVELLMDDQKKLFSEQLKKQAELNPGIKEGNELLLQKLDITNALRRADDLDPVKVRWSALPDVSTPSNFTPAANASFGSSQNFTFNIGNITGMDVDQITKELRLELGDLVST